MAIVAGPCLAGEGQPADSYPDLVALFEEWRAFERPPMLNGAPDYTAATMARMHDELEAYQARLSAFEIDDGPSHGKSTTTWSGRK